MPAPSGAVGDWIGKRTGDSHEGSFYDLVTRTYASVTRATPKTIYDPLTGRIHDVRAGYLAVNPWGAYEAGGRGVAPVIEEARTNYLVNSYGAANDGSGWTTGWADDTNVAGTPVFSILPGVYGNTAQRVQYTGVAGDASGVKYWQIEQVSAASSFAAGESGSAAVWLEGTSSGVSPGLRLVERDAADAYLGYTGVAFTLGSMWARVSQAVANLPANTSKVAFQVNFEGIGTGDTLDITIGAAQLEKGASATSYIPTTIATAWRDTDVVTVPTTGWDAAEGTIVAVCGESSLGDAYPWRWSGGTGNSMFLQVSGSNIYADSFAGGVEHDQVKSGVTYPAVLSMTWNNGSPIRAYANGSAGTGTENFATPTGLAASASIGMGAGSVCYSGPISRVIIFPTALTAGEVAALNGLIAGANAGGGNVGALMMIGVV